jgi:uncharacterized protein
MAATVFYFELPEKSSNKDRARGMTEICGLRIFTDRIEKDDKIAVKVHVGEKKNTTHVAPEVIREAIKAIKKKKGRPFLTETSTLYRGERTDGIMHLEHAYRHGFTPGKMGAPFIMADGIAGNSEIEVEIPGILHSSVSIAREAVYADGIVAVSHATGHMVSAIGACLKNLGMGLASRKGKLRQHSSMKPKIKPESCTFCKQCMTWCPADAIIEKDGKAFIMEEPCIGCGECLTVCKYNAVSFDWGTGSAELQKQIAEHAFGAVRGKENKCFYINCLFDMTKDCDCMGENQKPVMPDIGILASTDPVALDQATLDLTEKKFPASLVHDNWPGLDPEIQLEHGERIGLGSREYELTAL